MGRRFGHLGDLGFAPACFASVEQKDDDEADSVDNSVGMQRVVC